MYSATKIFLLCSLTGLVAAAGIFLTYQATYESRAVLLVRYVISRDLVDGAGSTVSLSGGGKTTKSIMSTELAIATSDDVAAAVAEAVGPKRILGAAGDSAADAARVVRSGLKVHAAKDGNIINVSYRSSDPELPAVILQRFLSVYFDHHLKLHRNRGSFELLTQQADRVRAMLNDVEGQSEELAIQARAAADAGTQAPPAQKAPELEERQRELKEQLAELRKRLETARVDEALDPSKIPNISVIQKPSPPLKLTRRRNRAVVSVAGAGVALGSLLALVSVWRRSPPASGARP